MSFNNESKAVADLLSSKYKLSSFISIPNVPWPLLTFSRIDCMSSRVLLARAKVPGISDLANESLIISKFAIIFLILSLLSFRAVVNESRLINIPDIRDDSSTTSVSIFEVVRCRFSNVSSIF